MKSSLLLAACYLVGQLPMLQAQSFSFQGTSPFGIKLVRDDETRAAQKIYFYDYDHDGDEDLLLSGLAETTGFESWDDFIFFMEIQYNTGTAESPQFGERTPLFDNFPYPRGYFAPAVGDLNNDGISDFISGADIDFIGNQHFYYLKGIGSQGNEFESIPLSTFDLLPFPPLSGRMPELVDLDLDGDLDLFASGYDTDYQPGEGSNIPITYYAKNTGTPTAPQFDGWYFQPYSFASDTTSEINTTGDIDNDGDVDIIGVGTISREDSLVYLYVHLNAPEGNGKPHFDEIVLTSPFGLPSVFGDVLMFSPDLVDIDGDGDLDLFIIIGDGQSNEVHFYENDLCHPSTTSISPSICEGEVYKYNGQSFSEAGVYEIPLSSHQGCDSTIVLTLEVTPLPTRQMDISICEGETFEIGGESFTASGDYMVFVSGSSGCDTLVMLTLEVLQLSNEIEVNNGILTSLQSFATYQWINCDNGESIPGATDQSFDVTATGNYAVMVSSGDCVVQSDCQHVIITSLDENVDTKGLTFYPNPTYDLINFLGSRGQPVSPDRVEVWSPDGILLLMQRAPSALNLKAFTPGVYVVRAFSGHDVVTQRIIKR